MRRPRSGNTPNRTSRASLLSPSDRTVCPCHATPRLPIRISHRAFPGPASPGETGRTRPSPDAEAQARTNSAAAGVRNAIRLGRQRRQRRIRQYARAYPRLRLHRSRHPARRPRQGIQNEKKRTRHVAPERSEACLADRQDPRIITREADWQISRSAGVMSAIATKNVVALTLAVGNGACRSSGYSCSASDWEQKGRACKARSAPFGQEECY